MAEKERERKKMNRLFSQDFELQSMIESRRGVYAIGSFIELFDNIVHWAVL